jgi:hypothetical protein
MVFCNPHRRHLGQYRKRKSTARYGDEGQAGGRRRGQNCSGGKLEFEIDDNQFEIDDVTCNDGRNYDLKLDASFS